MDALPVLQPGRYRHFKGNEYELLYVARHSETMEPMVVYRALYGERGVWVRPAAMWNETALCVGGGAFGERLTVWKVFLKNRNFLKKGVAFCWGLCYYT